tara:strand:+ start:578 stop:1372 length:795 start_codon:yes stop_codon:yes gene_type:complete
MDNRPIGIFDSGLGGMTVLKELVDLMPQESFVFFGDTAHVPYGNKSSESIENFSISIINFLQTHSVKLIVVACNTASAVVLNKIKKDFDIPIIGVIEPIKFYLQNNKTPQSIGIIGTENTINSRAYDKIILSYSNKIKIYSKSCPLFVPIIEEGLESHKITEIIAQEYLQTMINKKINLLILGCTHYPIIKNIIQNLLTIDVAIVDSANLIANYIKSFLNKNDMIAATNHANIKIYVSDQPIQFQKQSSKFFGQNIPQVIEVKL